MSANVRDYVLLVSLSAAAFGFDRWQRSRTLTERYTPPAPAPAVAAAEGENVILVVSDGLRWQEVFRGADSLLLFRRRWWFFVRNDPAVQRRFWSPTLVERRQALMPFVWGTIARDGQLFGNRDVGSSVRVTNGLNFSYPGYNELLVGWPDPRIDRNDFGPNPNVTVFEWLNRHDEFRGRVAAVGAWRAYADIFNQRRSGIQMYASRVEPLDARSHAAAMRFLRDLRPRALFVAYVETDDRAHDGRYDRLLEAVHAVDSYLAALWSAVQARPEYRGRTTLILTADHGRGRTPRTWTDHGRDVRGADELFVAMIGPGVPAGGELRNHPPLALAQIAATVAAALGLDYHNETPRAAAPIQGALVIP